MLTMTTTCSPLRFGILGTGNIANQFAAGVRSSRRCTLAAVGSRQADKARAFAGRYGIPTAHGEYQSLITDPAVDAVYVSLPNAMHHDWTVAALKAGKHVLCEKPMAAHAGEARAMFDAAKAAGRLLVEAFMYRSQPLMHAVKQQVEAGVIGEVRLIRSSFCFNVQKTDGNVRFDPKLAGGALMDIGCYCLNFSRWIAGAEPVEAKVSGRLHPAGIDDMVTGTLRFPGDVLASFTCGMATQIDNSAYVSGPKGHIEVPIPWKAPQQRAEYSIVQGTPPRMDKASAPAPGRQTYYVSSDRPLYALEADDFAAAVQDGASPVITAADTLGNMTLLDELRRQLGVPIPGH